MDVNKILHGLFTLLPSTFRLALLCTLATNHGDPSWFDPLLAKCRLRVDFDKELGFITPWHLENDGTIDLCSITNICGDQANRQTTTILRTFRRVGTQSRERPENGNG